MKNKNEIEIIHTAHLAYQCQCHTIFTPKFRIKEYKKIVCAKKATIIE